MKLPLPQYQCHKIVGAERIVSVTTINDEPDVLLVRLKDIGSTFRLPASRVPKGKDPLAGYFVEYDDGYRSWSPAETFVPSYTRINGTPNEDAINAVIERIRKQNTEVPCRENALAITKLEEAVHWLEARKKARQDRGVEGTKTV